MKKNLIFFAVIAVIIGVFLAFSDIQSVDEYYDEHLDEIREGTPYVTLLIDCKTAVDSGKLNGATTEYIPENGIILEKKRFAYKDGDTVYSLLNRVTKYYRVQTDFKGNDLTGIYVKGINYLYEFDCGELSGWMFKLNGSFPKTACDECYLKAEDEIEWVYSCDLGRDVGDEV